MPVYRITAINCKFSVKKLLKSKIYNHHPQGFLLNLSDQLTTFSGKTLISALIRDKSSL